MSNPKATIDSMSLGFSLNLTEEEAGVILGCVQSGADVLIRYVKFLRQAV
jgi:hypothetical protein